MKYQEQALFWCLNDAGKEYITQMHMSQKVIQAQGCMTST